jgi:hypothetical protein
MFASCIADIEHETSLEPVLLSIRLYLIVKPLARLGAVVLGAHGFRNHCRKAFSCALAVLDGLPNGTTGTVLQEMVAVSPECRTRRLALSSVRISPIEIAIDVSTARLAFRDAITVVPVALEVAGAVAAHTAAGSEGILVVALAVVCSLALVCRRGEVRGRCRCCHVSANAIDSTIVFFAHAVATDALGWATVCITTKDAATAARVLLTSLARGWNHSKDDQKSPHSFEALVSDTESKRKL